jgi:hypothetical protein
MCAPEVEGAEREFAFVAKRRCVVLQASAATHGMKVPETIGTRDRQLLDSQTVYARQAESTAKQIF